MYNFYVNDKIFFFNNFYSLVERLGKSDVRLYAPIGSDGIEDIKTIHIPIRRGHYSFFSLIKSLLIILESNKAEDINTYITIIPILLGGITYIFKRRKSIYYFTGLGTVFIDNSLKKLALKYIVVKILKIILDYPGVILIVQNNSDKELLQREVGIKKASIVLIDGCGINTDNFVFNPKYELSRKLNILVPARLIKEKGIVECIEASKQLKNQGVLHKFIFSSTIDSGNPSSLTKEEISKFSQSGDNIYFTGYVDDIRCLYNKADIVCLASYREGLPNSLLESAAIGRLIIASNVPGCNDIVEDWETGLLFEPRNAEAIVDVIKVAIANKKLIKKCIDKAREKIENKYSEKKVIQDLLEKVYFQ